MEQRIRARSCFLPYSFPDHEMDQNARPDPRQRDFDSILAHSTIVMIRYIFLAVEQRLASDDRTIGALFLAASDEMRDISLTEALLRILAMVRDKVRELYETSEQLVQQIIESTIKEALALVRQGFHAKCES